VSNRVNHAHWRITTDGSVEKRSNFLQDVENTVYGERQDQYGNPENSFNRIAEYWSTLFGITVTPQQVAMAMILLKIAREQSNPKRDNRIDMAGYAENLERMHL